MKKAINSFSALENKQLNSVKGGAGVKGGELYPVELPTSLPTLANDAAALPTLPTLPTRPF